MCVLSSLQPNVMVDDNTVKRNRNLFGSLVGHLRKAKTVLDQEKTTKAVRNGETETLSIE